MWRLFSQENFLNSTETKNQFREIFVKSSSHCCDFNKRRYDDKPGNEGNNFGSGEFSSQLITKQLFSNTMVYQARQQRIFLVPFRLNYVSIELLFIIK